MRGLVKSNDKRMTVREVAKVLEVSADTIKRSIKELFPDLIQNGKMTYLNETQITAVKYNLRKTARVINTPKTELEEELIIQQALVLQQEKIKRLQAENESLKIENHQLAITASEATENSKHADRHANYAITFLQEQAQEDLKKRVWLPYKDD